MRIEPGVLINNKYRIVRLLGEGGMGAVYEARHEWLGTECAIKVLHPALSVHPTIVARFVQEARVSATIPSPHVVRVIDVDHSPEGLAFLIMDLLHGESLSARLANNAPISMALACNVAVQTLTALEVAHSLGVVHRDIKPENIFLTHLSNATNPNDIFVKVLDFGLAKLRALGEVQAQLTNPGTIMGTPEYMAPEQVLEPDSVDLRTDIYAVGVILFEMLAGRRPIVGHDARVVATTVLSGQTPRLDALVPTIPRALADIVAIALAARPNHRFSSSAAMRQALWHAAQESQLAIGDFSLLHTNALLTTQRDVFSFPKNTNIVVNATPSSLLDPTHLAKLPPSPRPPTEVAFSAIAPQVAPASPPAPAPNPVFNYEAQSLAAESTLDEPERETTLIATPSPLVPPYGPKPVSPLFQNGNSNLASPQPKPPQPIINPPWPNAREAEKTDIFEVNPNLLNPSQPAPQTQKQKQHSRRASSNAWLIPVLIVAGVAGGGLSIWALVGSSQKPEPIPQPPVEDPEPEPSPRPKPTINRPIPAISEQPSISIEPKPTPPPPRPTPRPKPTPTPPPTVQPSLSTLPLPTVPPTPSNSTPPPMPPDTIIIPLPPLPFPFPQ